MTSRPEPAAPRVSSRATSVVLTVGAIVSASCFLGAILLQLAGRPVTPGAAMDPGTVIGGLLALQPWGWATLGVVSVIATPAAGLVATAVEYRGHGEALVALAVLAVLGASLAIALVR